LCSSTELRPGRPDVAFNSESIMMTIFSTPKPFKGHFNIIQRNAIKSWTLLHPDVEVILFGEDDGVAEVASEFCVRHEPKVGRNEYGTPLISSMFDRAQEVARHSIMCYVNCDIILLHDLREAVSRVAAGRHRFLMVGRRWDTDITDLIDFLQPDWHEQLRARALRTNKQRPPSWIDYFAFSRGQYYHKIPPFAVGRPRWDQWMIWFTYSSGTPIIDASRMVVAVHQNHDYSHHPRGEKGVLEGEEAKRNEILLGGSEHFYTVEDATHSLTARGMEYTFIGWSRFARPLLDLTRPVRRRLGLRRASLSSALGKWVGRRV